jgi:5'-nucleotidase
MNIINDVAVNAGHYWRSLAKAALLLVLATMVSGCYFYPAAARDYQRVGGTTPWWCKGTPDLAQQQCQEFSLNLDFDVFIASLYPKLSDLTVAGGTEVTNRPANIGVAYTKVATPTTFDPNVPNVFLYDGNSPTSRLVGFAWEINSGTAPAGFVGDRDVWTQNGTTGNWWLTAWVTRGYENHPDVFAASHPCLTSTSTILTSTTDACFTASHTEPFEVLVGNDDGYAAPGIDAVVEGLYALPNVIVHVVAPLSNQSGGAGNVTNAPYVISGSAVTTLSGRAATAVSSNDPAKLPSGSGWPADAVIYALSVSHMALSPELVVTGINQGQNMGSVTPLSGTVGAARAARNNGVPAIASSQGGLVPPNDFPTGVAATLALVEEWRLGHTVNTPNSVLNINIPTCTSPYVVRGTVQTVVATNTTNYALQDCSSNAPANSVISDIDAFNKGFIGIADVGAKKPPNWP